MTTVQEIELAAMVLGNSERALLVNRLSSGLEASGLLDRQTIDPRWAEIAERRLNEIVSGRVVPADGNAVMQRMESLARS